MPGGCLVDAWGIPYWPVIAKEGCRGIFFHYVDFFAYLCSLNQYNITRNEHPYPTGHSRLRQRN